MITTVLCNFSDCIEYHKEAIFTLLALSLLDPKKRSAKIAGEIFEALLLGKLSFKNRTQMLKEQARWSNILEAYKTIGQYSEGMQELKWTYFTKEGLITCRELIQFYYFSLGEYLLKGMAKNPENEVNGAAITWLQIARRIIPASSSNISKKNCPFSITRTLLESVTEGDKELMEFFMTLRSRLLILMNGIVSKLAPIFHKQVVERVPKLTLNCLLASICLSHRYEEPKRPFDAALLKFERTIYRNPIKRDHLKKYSFYYENTIRLPFQLVNSLEKASEIPSNELKTAICIALDTLVYIPNLVLFSYLIVNQTPIQTLPNCQRHHRSFRKDIWRVVSEVL
jgi:hypothetical protein